MSQATIEKSIEIQAPAAKLWELLTVKDHFLEWTRAFNPGGEATLEGDFALDAVLSFKYQDGTGLKGKVTDCTPARSLRIEYVGEYLNGEESTDASRDGSWIGGSEGYTLIEHGDTSTLLIHETMPAGYVELFDPAWDSALGRIKELAERK